MGQLTIYLDTETERKMQTMVKESGMSKSKWIANLIREKTTDEIGNPFTFGHANLPSASRQQST